MICALVPVDCRSYIEEDKDPIEDWADEIITVNRTMMINVLTGDRFYRDKDGDWNDCDDMSDDE